MSGRDQAERLRLFIAMPIPEAVRTELLKFQSTLKTAVLGDGIRWVKKDQFHLTLKFLGAVEAQRSEALISATKEACAGFAAAQLEAAGAGFFPDEKRPRVLWAGLHGEVEAVRALQQALEAAVGPFAERPEDRPFSPHLTLARLKNPRPAETRALAGMVSKLSHSCFGEWAADRVEVMRSELRPEGSRYACLAEIMLRTS